MEAPSVQEDSFGDNYRFADKWCCLLSSMVAQLTALVAEFELFSCRNGCVFKFIVFNVSFLSFSYLLFSLFPVFFFPFSVESCVIESSFSCIKTYNILNNKYGLNY